MTRSSPRLAARLRTLRAQLDLSDDDYVDLMTRAVQAIPYGTLHRSTFMPAVTVAGNSGVCADKSVLLASLLAHEGYDAGVWVFPSQAHAAVALRGNGPGLRKSGYSLVETTKLAYVGEVDYSLRAAGPVCEVPQLIRFGGGTKRYIARPADRVHRRHARARARPSADHPEGRGERSQPAKTAEMGASLPARQACLDAARRVDREPA